MRVFINNRNYFTWPVALAEELDGQGHEVIFIDNGSTYGPLVNWYKVCRYQVYLLPNLGKTALWNSGIAQQQTKPFVLTDPDLDIDGIPHDWPEMLLGGLVKYPQISKCGFSWCEQSVPPENPAWTYDKMYEHNRQDKSIAWTPMPNGDPDFYNYPIDTSFAVYRPGVTFCIDGIRARRPYTGLHWPWHLTLNGETAAKDVITYAIDEEVHYYFTHCENSSFTADRIKPMIEAYEKNL